MPGRSDTRGVGGWVGVELIRVFVKCPILKGEVLLTADYRGVGCDYSVLTLGVVGYFLVGVSEVDREVNYMYPRTAPARERASYLRQTRA